MSCRAPAAGWGCGARTPASTWLIRLTLVAVGGQPGLAIAVDRADAVPPAWPPFIIAALAADLLGAGAEGEVMPNCVALGRRAPLYSDLVYEDDPEARVLGLDLRLGGAVQLRFEADAQEEYNLGGATSLDANDDGNPDVVIHFSDRYGSGRDAYGALMLGCGDGDYLYSGLLNLGPAGAEGRIETVPGGLLVERAGRARAEEDPAAARPVVAGYRLPTATSMLEPVCEHVERAAVLDDLRQRAEER